MNNWWVQFKYWWPLGGKHLEGWPPRWGIHYLPASPKGSAMLRRWRVYVRWLPKSQHKYAGCVLSLSKKYGLEFRWMFEA